VRIADGLTTVGDEELLRRAVDNLLMNVLVHTPGDAVGTITASAADDRVTIEVSDAARRSAGQASAHLERFYRAGGPVPRSRSASPAAVSPAAVSPASQPRRAPCPAPAWARIAARSHPPRRTAFARLASPHGLLITLDPSRPPAIGPHSVAS